MELKELANVRKLLSDINCFINRKKRKCNFLQIGERFRQENAAVDDGSQLIPSSVLQAIL